ncbi:MAG TPA: lectin-like protein [Polyangiaceae bacterium]|nr:lectin-like protein [Polyangiaceae bacterium]
MIATACHSNATEPTPDSVSKESAALSASEWPSESLVATNSIQFNQRAHIDGNVAVKQASPGPVLAHNAEFALEQDAFIVGSVRADTIFLGDRSTVSGNAAYNGISGAGTPGSRTTPLSLPLAITLPTMPSVPAGTTAINVASNQTVTRASGNYTTVTLNQGTNGGVTRLNLSGGVYNFQSVSAGTDTRIECSADCEIRVSGRVLVGARSSLGYASGLGASNVRVAVGGSNGAAGPTGIPAAFQADPDARVEAYLFVPSGTARFGARVVNRGKVIAKDALLDNDVNATGLALPVITQQPQSITVHAGQVASFSVTATGTGLSYQWQRNGTNIAGATASTYSLTTTLANNGQQFRVIVTNAAGSVISSTATLTVVACTTSDTVCNGQDDDCDGSIDEDYVPVCGTGAGNPRVLCVSGVPTPSNCVDSNACNGTETCSAGACQAGTPPSLNDGNACTTDACTPATGITHTPVASGTACPDSTLCNGNETCNATGVCQAGTPPVVNDGNVCTSDSCDAVAGVVHTPVASGTPCLDGTVCNGAEACNATGTCAAGVPLVVNDGNECTVDSCDPVAGVSHTPSTDPGCPGANCTDEPDCVPGEVCEFGPTCAGQKKCVPGCRADHECKPSESCVVAECLTCPCPDTCEDLEGDAYEFRILYPKGVRRADVLFSATASLRVDDRARLGTATSPGAVAVFGTTGASTRTNVVVSGDVYSHGPVRLGANTLVNGFVRTQHGSVTLQSGAVVTGGVEIETPVPYYVYSWKVKWPATSNALDPVTSGVTTLVPGSYDSLDVLAGEVKLRTGVYYFNDLSTETGSQITADTTAGPILIYIKGDWTYRGPIVPSGGKPGSVMVASASDDTVSLEAPFIGTLVVPHGKVDVRNTASGHRGSVFARDIQASADAVIDHGGFPWDDHPDGPKNGDDDGADDSDDGCPDNPNKTTGGLCGCAFDSDDDTDHDGTPDCHDQCPRDPRNTVIGSCGCLNSIFLAAAGTPCVPEALSGRGRVAGACDGAGKCESPVGDGHPVIDTDPDAEGTCVEKEYDGGIYWFCTGPVPWSEANTACKAETGRRLARVDNFLEGEWMRLQLQEPAWVGGNDLNSDALWRWAGTTTTEGRPFWSGDADGDPLREAFINWASGSPTEGQCASLGLDGRWSSQACDNTAGFVCEQIKRYLPPPITDRPCDFYPDLTCDSLDPVGDDCVDPSTLGVPDNEADMKAAYDTCNEKCQVEGDPACDEFCPGWMTVPTTSCDEFDNEEDNSCAIDSSAPDFDPTVPCTSSADCDADEKCGQYYECARPDASGGLIPCSAGCPSGTICGTTAPYCIDPALKSACDVRDADNACVAHCFRGTACGHVGGGCASQEEPGFTNLCDEITVCSPDTVIATTTPVDEGLQPTEFVPEAFFPPAPDAPPALDYEPAKPPDCGGVDEPPCGDVYGIGEHPWCHYVPREGDSVRPDGPIDVSDDSDAIGDKKGGASSSVLSFSFDPNLELNYDIASFNPLSDDGFEVSAEASATASATLNLLGVQGSVKILDGLARVAADRCGFSGDSYLKLFGVDLLPIVLCGDPLEELANYANDSEFHDQCEIAITETQKVLNRAKKALRDAQELVRQYKELSAQGLRFSPDLCQQLLGDLDIVPEGFPFAKDCALVDPLQVVSMFIGYYQHEVQQLVEREQKMLTGAVQGALPGFKLSIPLNKGSSITVSTEAEGEVALPTVKEHASAGVGVDCDDEPAKQTQQITNVQFAIGPIPMNLTIDAFLSYGVSGSLDLALDGSAIGKVLLPDPGQPVQKHDLASANIVVTPYAKAGVELFLGAGFDFGPVAAKVGISGDLTLGNISLPVYGGAAIKLGAEVDTRPPPSDFLGIMPSYTLLFPAALPQKLTLSAGYRFGIDVDVDDILHGTINGKLRIKFFFFSKTWQVKILEFGPAFSLHEHLIHLEDDAEIASADTSALAKFQLPVPFPNFAEILGLPELSAYNSREFDGVRSLQTLAEVDPNDPRYVPFDDSLVGHLLYDGYCEIPPVECVADGGNCSSEGPDLLCCDERLCVHSSEGGATCQSCVLNYDQCTDHTQCCESDYEMGCFPQAYGEPDVCQPCVGTEGTPTWGADGNGDGVVDGGCCAGLEYLDLGDGFVECDACRGVDRPCAPDGSCCEGLQCDPESGFCEQPIIIQ